MQHVGGLPCNSFGRHEIHAESAGLGHWCWWPFPIWQAWGQCSFHAYLTVEQTCVKPLPLGEWWLKPRVDYLVLVQQVRGGPVCVRFLNPLPLMVLIDGTFKPGCTHSCMAKRPPSCISPVTNWSLLWVLGVNRRQLLVALNRPGVISITPQYSWQESMAHSRGTRFVLATRRQYLEPKTQSVTSLGVAPEGP